jgi:hypothetical protein
MSGEMRILGGRRESKLVYHPAILLHSCSKPRHSWRSPRKTRRDGQQNASVTCESCELRRRTRIGRVDMTSDEEARMRMLRASLPIMKSAVTWTRPGHRNTNLVADMEVAAAIGLQWNRHVDTNEVVAAAAIESESVRVVPSIHHPVAIATRREEDTDCITGYKAVNGYVPHLFTPDGTARISSMHYNGAGDWLKPIESMQDNALIIIVIMSVFVPPELATCSMP